MLIGVIGLSAIAAIVNVLATEKARRRMLNAKTLDLIGFKRFK